MRTFVFIILFIGLFACSKQKSAEKNNRDIDVMVYATHANDTTKIVSTDTAHLKLQ